jgi:hypothetical protein
MAEMGGTQGDRDVPLLPIEGFDPKGFAQAPPNQGDA